MTDVVLSDPIFIFPSKIWTSELTMTGKKIQEVFTAKTCASSNAFSKILEFFLPTFRPYFVVMYSSGDFNLHTTIFNFQLKDTCNVWMTSFSVYWQKVTTYVPTKYSPRTHILHFLFQISTYLWTNQQYFFQYEKTWFISLKKLLELQFQYYQMLLKST